MEYAGRHLAGVPSRLRRLRLHCEYQHNPYYLGTVTPSELLPPEGPPVAWKGQREPVELFCLACRTSWTLDVPLLARRISRSPKKVNVAEVASSVTPHPHPAT